MFVFRFIGDLVYWQLSLGLDELIYWFLGDFDKILD